MAQLKTIEEVECTITTLGELLELIDPDREMAKLLCDPLCYALLACDVIKEEVQLKDPENAYANLDKHVRMIVQLINSVDIKPPYNEQVNPLVMQLQEFKVENLSCVDESADIEGNESEQRPVILGM